VTQRGRDAFSRRPLRRDAPGRHDLTRRRRCEGVDGRPRALRPAALEQWPVPEASDVVALDLASAGRAVIVVDLFPVIARVTAAVRDVWKRGGRGQGAR
jgi:hypothetical protein